MLNPIIYLPNPFKIHNAEKHHLKVFVNDSKHEPVSERIPGLVPSPVLAAFRLPNSCLSPLPQSLLLSICVRNGSRNSAQRYQGQPVLGMCSVNEESDEQMLFGGKEKEKVWRGSSEVWKLFRSSGSVLLKREECLVSEIVKLFSCKSAILIVFRTSLRVRIDTEDVQVLFLMLTKPRVSLFFSL